MVSDDRDQLHALAEDLQDPAVAAWIVAARRQTDDDPETWAISHGDDGEIASLVAELHHRMAGQQTPAETTRQIHALLTALLDAHELDWALTARRPATEHTPSATWHWVHGDQDTIRGLATDLADVLNEPTA